MKSNYLAVFLPLFLSILPASAVTVGVTGPTVASQPVGTSVNWTASNMAQDGKTLQYRWIIAQNGVTMVSRDFGAMTTISYAPMQEGAYTVTVTARDSANLADTGVTSATYTATSLLTSLDTPVVTGTSNPLVAIYSASCTAGAMRVFFASLGTAVTNGSATPYQNCVPGQSVNFQIAGMTPNTTYTMAYQVSSGFSFTNGPVSQFRTGAIPPGLILPTMTVRGVSQGQPVILNSYLGSQTTIPVAYDTSGNVIWYYSGANQLLRPFNGGTMMVIHGESLQEIDLLGNIIRETNISRVGEELTGAPFNIINSAIPNRIAGFNHDAIRLPNGNIAVLAGIEQIADQGQGPVDVLGDAILVLDDNFQVVWAWSGFQHLNVMRKAILGETCVSNGPGCPVLQYGAVANDWMHANSLAYTGDNNIILSIRHQDWVLKIDYASGAGAGDILWTMGNQGNFALLSGNWFSHQHNVTLTGTEMTLFDNANGDHDLFNGSRGLALTIDEAALTATISTEARMNIYSYAVGSAQRLFTNNLYFLAGVPTPNSSEAIEFSPGPGEAAPMVYFDMNSQTYRSFRMSDLYTP